MVDETITTAKLRQIKTVSMIGILTAGHVHAQTINNANMQNYFNDVCDRIVSSPSTGSILSTRRSILAASQQGQSDLFNSCIGYYQSEGGLSNGFFSGLSAEGFEALRLDALLFAQTENDNAMDRLQALRRARETNNQTTSQFDSQPSRSRGGSAGADDEGGLLSKTWGVWAHVNSSRGDKDLTALTSSFGSTQRSFALGSDYRFGSDAVLGASISRRDTNAIFGPSGAQGGMDSKTWAFSVYGSSFFYDNWYIDAVVSYAAIDYDTQRTMIDSGFVPTHTALGTTDGRTFSVGHTIGYDFNRGPLTVTPSLGYLYIDSKTDAFEELGADGLDLAFEKQHARSTTMHFDVNAAYALNSSIGVWQPYVRAQWVREFDDGIDTLDVRFVNDVDPAAAPFRLQFDELDRQYWRVNVGVSAQFKHDLAGYLDYRQLVGFQAVTLRTVTFGMRMQF